MSNTNYHSAEQSKKQNIVAMGEPLGELYSALSMNDINQFESTLRLNLAPHLDEAVIELAGKYSFRTKLKVKRLIANSGALPPEIDAMLDELAKLENIDEQKQAT